MSQKHFIKVKEDFVCKHCGIKVSGGGYTNHCPKCLYSLHVDDNVPGDRKAGCNGLMAPVGVDKKGDNFVLIHKCVKCGKVMKNKMAPEDDFDAALRIK